MVAPGAAYDFFEAPAFRARTKDMPELVLKIEDHVRQYFDRLEAIEKNVSRGEIEHLGYRYGFTVIRLGGSKLTLQQIWNLDTQQMDKGSLEKIQELRRKR